VSVVSQFSYLETFIIGSVLVSGSNPNPDYTVGADVKYPTEYRTELFYPLYYNQRRPQPQGLLAQYSYGGPNFVVSLSSDDLFGNVDNVKTAKVVIIRTGFATHAMVCCAFIKMLLQSHCISFFFFFCRTLASDMLNWHRHIQPTKPTALLFFMSTNFHLILPSSYLALL
jgi:hypothetical protein